MQGKEAAPASQSQGFGLEQPKNLSPELHQSFYEFPKPTKKAGTPTFPFLTSSRLVFFKETEKKL